MAGPAQVAGLPGPEALQAAGDYDELGAAPAAPEGGGGAEPLVITITITPNGQITVGDAAGMVEPQPAESLEDALASAGELAQELSKRMAVQAMEQAKQGRPGNQDAQALWDQMAAEREQQRV